MTKVLSQRALNRATLARQYLLDRAPVTAIDAIEHLGGMQSQAPLAAYVGLWARLRDFAPGELSALTEQRQVVRLHLMRNTVHLVSARDCLDWRPLFSPLHTAQFSARFRLGIAGVDRDALLRHARQLLEEQPRTRTQLGRLLAQRWPDADPAALAYAATHHIPLCQVPPRGIWGKTGPAAWAPVESWLGAPLRAAPVDGLVLRYLGGCGRWQNGCRCGRSTARPDRCCTTCPARPARMRTCLRRHACCPNTTTCCSPTKTGSG